ncbi:hypothetical protein EX30DRAFT_395687 [Ascodesmis nigricans]|uniref:Hydrophobin n=1 Tax=Ascodesmis nigricans TaxID=341454 RepID=A0A4S2MWZ1_9PEZI|nr:hypothetical protein EX30DRAFT_395687 [Ascodesmis nigricans]
MKLSIITLTLAATAIAAPTTNGNDQSGCRAEEAPMCCNPSNSIGPGSGSGLLSGIGGLLGLGGLLGNPFQYVFLAADCIALPIIGGALGGASCTQQQVCCQNVVQNGLINLGCNPLKIL